ncbi:class I SAM-dependent methyltransferase [Bacteriovoracales bacterium]|nr:class I SAM-dependent methyltransferase [Bacteriovoracales bacterium]
MSNLQSNSYDDISKNIITCNKTSEYQKVWEKEASEDSVKSAAGIDRIQKGNEIDQLLVKIPQFYENFKSGKHYGHILEFGPGYGRIPLYLSKKKDVQCNLYTGIDISINMLKKLDSYFDKYDTFPNRKLIRQENTSLPVENDSVDLIISSAVFLHMNKESVIFTLKELNRVAKKGCEVHFIGSFPNFYGLGSFPSNFISFFKGKKTNYMKFYSLSEVQDLLKEHFDKISFDISVSDFSVFHRKFPKAIPFNKKFRKYSLDNSPHSQLYNLAFGSCFSAISKK